MGKIVDVDDLLSDEHICFIGKHSAGMVREMIYDTPPADVISRAEVVRELKRMMYAVKTMSYAGDMVNTSDVMKLMEGTIKGYEVRN